MRERSARDVQQFGKSLVADERIRLQIGDNLQCQRLAVYRIYSTTFEIKRQEAAFSFINRDNTNPIRLNPLKTEVIPDLCVSKSSIFLN